MERIKQIVDSLRIQERRELLEENRIKILGIKKEMSDLCFHKNVAQYAYDSERLKELVGKVIIEHDESVKPEIARLRAEIDILAEDPYVIEYKALRFQLQEMELDNIDYFKTINIDLRERLIEEDLPSIYVYQGLLTPTQKRLYRNIINPEKLTTDETAKSLIVPKYAFTSRRKERHFYSHTSFHYLEQLSQDYEYGLEGKKLPRTRVLVKEKKN